jgi:hypothetical protein
MVHNIYTYTYINSNILYSYFKIKNEIKNILGLYLNYTYIYESLSCIET